jgi:hypothetical protein
MIDAAELRKLRLPCPGLAETFAFGARNTHSSGEQWISGTRRPKLQLQPTEQ